MFAAGAGCLCTDEQQKLERLLKCKSMFRFFSLSFVTQVTGISGSIWSPWDLGWRERKVVNKGGISKA